MLHVNSKRRKYEIIYGGYGFGEGNEAGERVLDFVFTYDTVINTYFRRKQNPGLMK